MTKLYIKVPALGGKPAHWSLISTNALGPTPTAEGLLHLKQDDGAWHRHVPRNYPNEAALRVRLKNGDWPETLRLAQVLGIPAMWYSVLGYTRPPYVPPGTSAWITRPEGARFFDGSTPILPQPYPHNPFETYPFFPYNQYIHIPSDTAPFYAGHDPAVFYPAVTWGTGDPASIYNANGYASQRVANGGAQPVAFAKKDTRNWEIVPPAGQPGPYFLFPQRLEAQTQYMHVVVDLRWIREHTTVQNIQAVEIEFSGYYQTLMRSNDASEPTGFNPAEYQVRLLDTTGSVPVHEETIAGPTVNFYAAIDPDAMVHAIGGSALNNARLLFEADGTDLVTYTTLGETYVIDELVSFSDTSGSFSYRETRSFGLMTHKMQLAPSDFQNTDYMTFMLATDPVPDPVDENHNAPSITAALTDVKVNLYN